MTNLHMTISTEFEALEDYESPYLFHDHTHHFDHLCEDLFDDLSDLNDIPEDEVRNWLLNFYTEKELTNYGKAGFTLRDLAEYQQLMGEVYE
jgi:hypothetical protein